MSQKKLLIDNYLDKAGRDWLKFEGFTDYSHPYPEVEPHISIAYGYKSANVLAQFLALIMNGCVTCGKRRFMLSRNILQEYLELDPNFSRKTFNGSQMNKMLKALLSTGLVSRIVESSQYEARGNGRKAAIYEVVDPEFLIYLPEYYQVEYPK
jgi:hypothetical protein